jgi:predicted  nucleic acid-binding Zn-ribbon protein
MTNAERQARWHERQKQARDEEIARLKAEIARFEKARGTPRTREEMMASKRAANALPEDEAARRIVLLEKELAAAKKRIATLELESTDREKRIATLQRQLNEARHELHSITLASRNTVLVSKADNRDVLACLHPDDKSPSVKARYERAAKWYGSLKKVIKG